MKPEAGSFGSKFTTSLTIGDSSATYTKGSGYYHAMSTVQKSAPYACQQFPVLIICFFSVDKRQEKSSYKDVPIGSNAKRAKLTLTVNFQVSIACTLKLRNWIFYYL